MNVFQLVFLLSVDLILSFQDINLVSTTAAQLTKQICTTVKYPMILPISSNNSTNFIAGPTIKPYDLLLAWLNEEANLNVGSRKRFRLPVLIHFEDSYRLAIGNAYIGTNTQEIEQGAPSLALDDTAMGVSLLSTLRDICPQDMNFCAIWLEGYWGTLLELDLPDISLEGENEGWPFSVLSIGDLIEGDSEQHDQIRVFIQAPLVRGGSE